ncbi:hypothetical protein FQR65_LT18287 [Abscondita terminalis]|nr:hypothetical protein FQR65_LT18287 [Abscondita terminalis]
MFKLIIALQVFVFTFLSDGSYLKMPSFAYPGESVLMECNIDHGDLPIVSITWLKDNQEFYKYDPNQPDPVNITNVVGILVKKDLSRNGNKITISSVSEESTGVYICRVEIDHPDLDVGELSEDLKLYVPKATEITFLPLNRFFNYYYLFWNY